MRYVVNKESTLSNIADAIRLKDGSEDPIAIVDIPEHIRKLKVGDCIWIVNHYKEGSTEPDDTDNGACKSGEVFEFPVNTYTGYYSPTAYSAALVGGTINIVNYYYLEDDNFDSSDLVDVTVNNYKQNFDKTYNSYPSEVDRYIVETTDSWEAPVKEYLGYGEVEAETIDLTEETTVDYQYKVESGGGEDVTVQITQNDVSGIDLSYRVIGGTSAYLLNEEKAKYIYDHFNKENRDNIIIETPLPNNVISRCRVVGCYLLKKNVNWLNYRDYSPGMISPNNDHRAYIVVAIHQEVDTSTSSPRPPLCTYIYDLGFLIYEGNPYDPITYVKTPAVSGNYIYDGTEKSAIISTYDSNLIEATGDFSATNAGTYSVTLSLKDPVNCKWDEDETTADKTFNWYIGKAYQTISLSTNGIILDNNTTSATVTVSEAVGEISVTSSDSNIVAASINNNIITITENENDIGGGVYIIVNAATTANYEPAQAKIKILVNIGTPIYGAEWDGSSVTSWDRTDYSILFSAPSPALSNGTGSSPFDTIMPWAGMVRITDSEAGELVAIPKYYFKLSYSDPSTSTGLKIQISSEQFEGSQISPAHMDRGDGQGERDIIYVGRYHCASDYKSKTGVTPKRSTERYVFRGDIKRLGDGIWQWDYATYWTIAMLYLVEFADWNSQMKIGYGCSDSGSVQNTGLTDSMQYHTGTTKSSRTTYGHTQYRYIEDLWGNSFDWVDGIYFSGTAIFVVKNPNRFTDQEYGEDHGVQIGTRISGSGNISGFTISSVNGYTWVLYPTKFTGSTSTYVCDYASFTGGVGLAVGGDTYKDLGRGLFRIQGYNSSVANSSITSRLMKLPNTSNE